MVLCVRLSEPPDHTSGLKKHETDELHEQLVYTAAAALNFFGACNVAASCEVSARVRLTCGTVPECCVPKTKSVAKF